MAAGLGFKTFTTGEVLTAADVNGYLMQGILVFANATARDAAITSPQEGQCCYLKDTDAVLTYSGSAWVGFDDSNAIQNSIINAKGDLISGSANDTPAILSVGSNGETLVADSLASTGLRWQADWNTGKNKLINADFYYNQRAFTSTTTTSTYGFDRWQVLAAGGTTTYSAETFTAGAAPVAGYEGKSFARLVSTGQSAAADRSVLTQRIEDVRTLAGQTATISFWAKASTGTPSVAVDFAQGFGTSGSATVNVTGQKVAITSSWARYSLTFSIPSISGKTIGTGSDQLQVRLWTSAGSDWNTHTNTLGIQSVTIDFWGVQVEAGSVATPFTTATGTLAGELHVCKRYYEKSYNIGTTPGTNTGTGSFYYGGTTNVSNNVFFQIPFSAEKRGTPTMTFYTTSGTSGQLTYARSGVGATNATATGYQIGTTTAGVYVGAGAQYVACELGGHWVAEAEL